MLLSLYPNFDRDFGAIFSATETLRQDNDEAEHLAMMRGCAESEARERAMREPVTNNDRR